MSAASDSARLEELVEQARALDPHTEGPAIASLYAAALKLAERASEPRKSAAVHAVFAPLLTPPDAALSAYHEAIALFGADEDPEIAANVAMLAAHAGVLRLSEPNPDIELAIGELWRGIEADPALMLALAELYERRTVGDPLDNWRTRTSLLENRLGQIDFRQEPVAWARCNDEAARAVPEEPNCDWGAAVKRRVERHRVSLEILGDAFGRSALLSHLRLSEALLASVGVNAAENHAFAREALRHAESAFELATDDIDADLRRMAIQHLATCAILGEEGSPERLVLLLERLGRARDLLDPLTHPLSTANLHKAIALLREATLETLDDPDAVADVVERILDDTGYALGLLGAEHSDERYQLHTLRGRTLLRIERYADALEEFERAFDRAHELLATASTREGRLETTRWVGATSGMLAHLHLLGGDAGGAIDVLERGRTQLGADATAAPIDVVELVPDGGALILGCFAHRPGWAIVVTGRGTTTVSVPELDRDTLGWLVAGDTPERALGGWFAAYAVQGSAHPATRQRFLDTIVSIAAELERRFWMPVIAALEGAGVSDGAELVLVHHGAAAGLPFNASLDANAGIPRALAERFVLRTAPSLRMLRAASKASPAAFGSAGVIADPRENLDYEALEVHAVSSVVDTRAEIAAGSAATVERVLELAGSVDVLHVSAHANHQVVDVWSSRLELAEGIELSLAELSTALAGAERVPQLVFLAACESGTPRLTSHASELLGFPTILLESGVGCVIASQWLADDIATALLSLRFYAALAAGASPAVALQRAQTWLRESTAKALAGELRRLGRAHTALSSTVGKLRLALSAFDGGARPFEHPWYWAAFVAHGA